MQIKNKNSCILQVLHFWTIACIVKSHFKSWGGIGRQSFSTTLDQLTLPISNKLFTFSDTAAQTISSTSQCHWSIQVILHLAVMYKLYWGFNLNFFISWVIRLTICHFIAFTSVPVYCFATSANMVTAKLKPFFFFIIIHFTHNESSLSVKQVFIYITAYPCASNQLFGL